MSGADGFLESAGQGAINVGHALHRAPGLPSWRQGGDYGWSLWLLFHVVSWASVLSVSCVRVVAVAAKFCEKR